ncbi:MAG: hypothetical protein EA385_02590 [Salinarimonadaceae bacterium]|nr:MAG: hypothetical protein EA385_02590 [Salinarimonadaceae bacterium]
MTEPRAGVLSIASSLPPRVAKIEQIFSDEGALLDARRAARLGVRETRVFEGESPTELALDAALAALAKAEIGAMELDAIIDFSTMPQRYVEPAWSMSNELQHLLGARNAFTLGYSGGGCANLLVAMKFARALLRADEDARTILLVASDVALTGNRVIDRDDPLTILGDGATAMIMRRDAGRATLVDVALSSEGRLHDARLIPGGGIRHPTRLDLHRLVVDRKKIASVDRHARARDLAAGLLEARGVPLADVAHVVTPNLSAEDVVDFAAALCGDAAPGLATLAAHGHANANDLILNLARVEQAGIAEDAYVLLASHGLGFLAGAALLRY